MWKGRGEEVILMTIKVRKVEELVATNACNDCGGGSGGES
jgi:hypothetical protein